MGTAEFWDGWQRNRGAEQRRADGAPRWVDWGDHPRILELLLDKLFGPPPRSLFECLAAMFPQLKHGHALSLCCGDGAFERELVRAGVFARVTGIDIAPGRIASAAEANGLTFQVGDVNSGQFGERQYDAVVAKAALHHVERLEAALQGVCRALKPGGCLIAIDFFGPTRFQWTDAQLAAVNRFLEEEVPESLRRQADGTLYRAVRPTVAEMIAADPSEAVRSGDILPLIHRTFRRAEVRDIGGTLLHLIFASSIVNNFDEANPGHNRIVERAFALEESLLRSGALEADFKFVVAHAD